MDIIIGVDPSAECGIAASIVQRLQCNAPRYHLAHVIERLVVPAAAECSLGQSDIINMIVKQQDADGRQLLADAAASFATAKIHDVQTHLRYGLIANELMELAARENAPLIAIGSPTRSPLERIANGSVSRKLVINAPCSLLLARDKPLPPGPLSVVLATDHSPAAARYAAMLLAWLPRGIGRITVLTSFPKNLVAYSQTLIPHFKGDLTSWIEKQLHDDNQRLIARLADGIKCTWESRVISARPELAIGMAMEETGASLLVLGAQGHGFMHRATIGSVSFHQAMHGQHHTLILREPVL